MIRDPKTNSLLWAFNAEWALLLANRDKSFDQAMARLVGNVRG